ncbi:MAG: isochorismatase family protein [Planctomycetaceae bacterium]|nr:isochorismatase family protein [Planctomycetaceae bacterium]
MSFAVLRHCLPAALTIAGSFAALDAGEPAPRVYKNELRELSNPPPLLADHPEYIQPIEEVHRYEAPILVDDAEADLDVRAWRFSYNARGIIEMPNRLDGDKTAIVVVHPWGIDDGQGWKMPNPAGVAYACTFEKNALMLQHAADVINPFLEAHRDTVKVVLYSLPNKPDPIRTRLYRSTTDTPTPEERAAARVELTKALAAFDYGGEPIPADIPLTTGRPAIDYFKAFPGIDSSVHYNGADYWNLPIPVMSTIDVADNDVVLYDRQEYPALKEFLQSQGVEHVLLCGYHADMCVCLTTAGYKNLKQDFNVFLVGDAVQATLPANKTGAYATNQAVSYAALDLLITQASWVKPLDGSESDAAGK